VARFRIKYYIIDDWGRTVFLPEHAYNNIDFTNTRVGLKFELIGGPLWFWDV
jgi:hypothetical protein